MHADRIKWIKEEICHLSFEETAVDYFHQDNKILYNLDRIIPPPSEVPIYQFDILGKDLKKALSRAVEFTAGEEKGRIGFICSSDRVQLTAQTRSDFNVVLASCYQKLPVKFLSCRLKQNYTKISYNANYTLKFLASGLVNLKKNFTISFYNEECPMLKIDTFNEYNTFILIMPIREVKDINPWKK
jgi:hypothetical protein